MAIWTNSDGLTIRYHRDEGVVNTSGRVPIADGTQNVLEYDLTWSKFNGTTGTQYDTPSTVRLPKGVTVTRAFFIVTQAFTSGGSATLDIGYQQEDGTEIDNDGLIAATALSTINAVGKQVEGAGAMVKGVLTTQDGYLYVKANTAAFTAGKGKLIVYYTYPAV